MAICIIPARNLRSAAEENEPDHCKDQDYKPERNGKQRGDGRAGLAQTRFGRRFDDLTLISSRCHGALNPRFLLPKVRERTAGREILAAHLRATPDR